MTALLLTACVGMITGAFLIFRISPMDFTLGVFRRLTAGPKSIRDEINETTRRKKPGLFRREISEAQTVLQATGKEERFPVLCAASLLLFAVGAGIAIIVNNLLLVPVLAAGMMFLPFWYIKLTAGHYRKAVTAELETALSIITTAYLRSEDLQTAVEENINYLNPPVHGVFRSFLTRIKHIDPDMNAALAELKSAIDNEVWREWCEALSACQYDHSMKSTLNPIVGKLSDMRIINGELENLVFAPRKEFISMAALVVLNIPLLYFLNKDWYATLMTTVPGKAVLAVCAAAIFLSLLCQSGQADPANRVSEVTDMTILLFLFGVAVAAGLFFILADILKLPRLSTEKALLSAGRAEKKRMRSLDAIFLGWAIKLSKFIRMDEYKRHRMERTLSAAGMDMTPEVYLAYTILKPAAALLAVIPCLLIFPLLSPIVVLLSILLYFKESRKAEEKVAERREKIEGELPRFVATVEQELGASRDVLTILENYKRHAGPDFARELDVLTADMRSSSYEAALVRFEGRLASPMLSDIVRGLIGVLRGDDGRIYFQMLSHDMKQLELQRLKAQAAKIPPKIRVYSFVMLVCFMLIYIVVILMQILTSMGGLFG